MEKLNKYTLSKSINGWNWGTISLEDNNAIKFYNQNKEWFSVNTNNISNLATQNKNELGFELNYDDKEALNEEDMLCEIKLYIPTKNTEHHDEDKSENVNSIKNNNSENTNKADKEIIKSADYYKKEINKITSSAANLGDTIAIIPDINMLTPRGKINVIFLKNTLKLSGQSYDYKISYNNFQKTFLLTRQDGIHLAFVVCLKTAMRHGNTSYPFLVFQFKKNSIITVDIQLPEDDKLKNQIFKNGNIPDTKEKESYDVMASLFKNIIGVSVSMQGKFKSSQNVGSIKCSYKANEGYLYPLEKNIIYIVKPTLLISLEEISNINFERLSESSQRYFEMSIFTKKGDTYIFNNIEKNEYSYLNKYFVEKNINVSSDQDVEGEDNIIVTKKVRKAPELNEEIYELPPDEDSYVDDEDESFEDEEEDK